MTPDEFVLFGHFTRPKCPLCGSRRTFLVLTGPDLYRCDRCCRCFDRSPDSPKKK